MVADDHRPSVFNYLKIKKMTAHCLQPDYFDQLSRLDIFLLHQSIFLSPQELHVLYWAKQGMNNREIAAKLGTAACTVKTHKNNLISKLGLEGKTGFQQFLLKLAQHQLISH